MSSETIRLFLRPSGTSPRTMRWASPSTIAVLPTPGSPISTGLFLVRRDSTWMTRRISSSRPMTGSSLPCPASLRQVAAIFLERLVGRLRVLRRHALAAAHFPERLHQALAGDAGFLEQLAGRAGVVGGRQQEVLDGDVLVLQLPGFVLGVRQKAVQAGADVNLVGAAGRSGDLRHAVDLGKDPPADGVDIHSGLGQDRRSEPVLLSQKRRQQMFDIDLLLAVPGCQALRRSDRFLRLLSETIDVHTNYFAAEH